MVLAAFTGLNVTEPGPVTFPQTRVSRPGGFGKPSSATEAVTLAVAGNTTVGTGLIVTTGLPSETMLWKTTLTSSVLVLEPSDAEKRNTPHQQNLWVVGGSGSRPRL